MTVTAVVIENSIQQALFEIYVHLELRTPFNDFRNH